MIYSSTESTRKYNAVEWKINWRGIEDRKILIKSRAPDNFLKQGVADALLEAKGVFLQNAEVFSLPSFTPVRFYKLQI